ncbi:MAG: MaoC family dehydratase [Chloroflexi bacterium]|nr:MAG: MaoC family dehydratase [Chloroflexota bacterium]
MTRYFEDFQVGDIFDLGRTSATQEEIIAFARQFDPQPFHTDPERAKELFFGELVASGWHTISLFMRLLDDELINETISMGSPGVDEVRWILPVRPDEVLRGRFTVLASTASQSRANLGIIRSRGELLNPSDQVVMSLLGTHFIGRRPNTSTESNV